MRVSATQLRADIYNLIDQVLATGEPLEIERGGKVLRLVPPRVGTWVDRLPRREGKVTGDPDDLAALDWSAAWSPDPA